MQCFRITLTCYFSFSFVSVLFLSINTSNQPAMTFKCNLCLYSTELFPLFQKHYIRCHRHDPNFSVACCIGSCAYTTKTWNNFKVHVHQKHHETSDNAMDADIALLQNNDEPEMALSDECIPDVAHFNAMFTLCLETKFNMSQAAIDNVVSTAQNLVEHHLHQYKQKVIEKMDSLHVDSNVIEAIKINTKLDFFASNAKRLSYYRMNVDCLVEPKRVLMGKKFLTKNGKIRELPKYAYIIPLRESLNQLLQMPEIWEEIQNPHLSRDEYMHDICDGEIFVNHTLFSSDPQALQIIFNCDEIEVVNPLGSHVKKHKITMFYFTLGNIRPEYRSKLHVIQLVAVCKSRDVRNMCAEKKLLADFIGTIMELETRGITFPINGTDHVVKGTLLIAPADTLAANWLGKFKEGVSFALRNCRRCEIENTKIKHIFVERQVQLRIRETHNERCNALSDMSKPASRYWSKIWGINAKSVLCDLSGFDLMTGLVSGSNARVTRGRIIAWNNTDSISIHLCSIIIYTEMVQHRYSRV